MNFLIFWLGTSALSFCMEMSQELRMYKDAADYGYKINSEKMSEFSKQLNPNGTKITLLSMLIPIINMMLVIQRTMQYNDARPYILDQLRALDALEEMSEYEKKEYAKKPTGFNAFLVPLKLHFKLATSSISIKINDENGESQIFFEREEKSRDIIILKVTGEASKWTVEEQKQAVNKAWSGILSAFNKKYDDINSLAKDLKSRKVLNLNDEKDNEHVELHDENAQKLKECEEKKQELLTLRSSLANKDSENHSKEQTKLLKK